MKKLSFLKSLNSPFKPFKIKFHLGKISIGTPYFYPRRWVYYKGKQAIELASKKKYPEGISEEGRKKMFDNSVESYKKTQYATPKKIGFDFVGLGWKTKWDPTDYRFEWAPLISFVFFKWQIAIMFISPEECHYWEAWLYYERNTDRIKSKKERIKDCMDGFSLIYKRYSHGKEDETINYYESIIKPKYIRFYTEQTLTKNVKRI
jgi:hypothetical protein